jgi:hypothetical protein
VEEGEALSATLSDRGYGRPPRKSRCLANGNLPSINQLIAVELNHAVCQFHGRPALLAFPVCVWQSVVRNPSWDLLVENSFSEDTDGICIWYITSIRDDSRHSAVSTRDLNTHIRERWHSPRVQQIIDPGSGTQ